MATLLIEYDDNNKTIEQMFEGLFMSGLIRRPDGTASCKQAIHRLEFLEALYEAKEMEKGLAQGKKYKTLDELLNEED